MSDTKAPSDPRLAWYRRMIEIRLFEDKVQELFMTGLIQGTTLRAKCVARRGPTSPGCK